MGDARSAAVDHQSVIKNTTTFQNDSETSVNNVVRDYFHTNNELYSNLSSGLEPLREVVNVSNATPEQPHAPFYIVVTATLFYVLIFLVGIFGNSLVIVVIAYSRTMKTAMNVYLLNLCVADVLIMVVCMPTALAEIYTMEVWYFGEAMCKLVPFIENTIANASVLTILAISIERYRVVCKPTLGIEDDLAKAAKIVVCIWVISSVASVPCLYIAVYRSSKLMDGTPIMVCRNPIYLLWQRVYVVLLAVLFFLLPCSLLFGLYCRLCRILLKANRYHKQHACACGDDLRYTNRRRLQSQVINIIASIVIIFFICHLPLRVAGLWFTFEDKLVIYSLGLENYLKILFSTRIMFYMNHALNPIVYNFMSTKFRSVCRTLFTRKSHKCRLLSTNKKRKHSYVFTKRTRALPSENGKPDQHVKTKTSSSSLGKRNDFFGIPNVVERRDNRVRKPSDDDYAVMIEYNELAVRFTIRKGNTEPR